MKKVYPRYKQGEILLIKSKLDKKDSGILEKFLIYCGTTCGERKLKNFETKMLQIIDVSEISYGKWDLDILRQFLGALNKSDLSKATKNDVKKVLKRFLKEQYSDWSNRFKNLSDIKGENDVNHEKLNANTIFTSEELEQLIRGAESLKFKALILLMYESAGRPEEILKLRWKDLNLDKGDVKLHSSKTGNVRVNPIKESIIHLRRYKQEYPYLRVQAEDFIFPAPNNRKEHFSVSYFSTLFSNLGKKILNRSIFPYLLRHTRATELQKKLPPKIYEKFMDHSIETATRYSHLDKDDVREVMLEKIYHIEELTEQEKEEIKELRKQVENQGKEIKKLKEISNQKEAVSKSFLSSKEFDKILQEKFKSKGFVKEIKKFRG